MIVTAVSLVIWAFLLVKIQNGNEEDDDSLQWYLAAVFTFSLVFLCQGLSVALFVASYTTIKKAAVTLGLKQSEK